MTFSMTSIILYDCKLNQNKLAPILFNVFSMEDKLTSVNFNVFTESSMATLYNYIYTVTLDFGLFRYLRP